MEYEVVTRTLNPEKRTFFKSPIVKQTVEETPEDRVAAILANEPLYEKPPEDGDYENNDISVEEDTPIHSTIENDDISLIDYKTKGKKKLKKISLQMFEDGETHIEKTVREIEGIINEDEYYNEILPYDYDNRENYKKEKKKHPWWQYALLGGIFLIALYYIISGISELGG